MTCLGTHYTPGCGRRLLSATERRERCCLSCLDKAEGAALNADLRIESRRKTKETA